MQKNLFPTTLLLLGLVLVVGPVRAVAQTAAAADDVGYSTDSAGPAPVASPRSSPPAPDQAAKEEPAKPPALSINLDAYARSIHDLDAPSRQPPVPSASAPPVPTPARPAPLNPPPTPASRHSPVMAMLESTLQGNYAETLALKARMPKKAFTQRFDRATANKYSQMGNNLLNKQDDPPGAVRAYETAYANDQSSSEINGSYGYALFRTGRFAEARDMEMEALEISPGYGAAWFVLGQILGYLKQEDLAYASFVNTCLFTKNMTTTLGFLDREKDKYGEICVQNAAAKALATCQRLARDETPWREPMPASPVLPAAVPAGDRRIGKIDIKAIVLGSKQFQEMLTRLADMRGLSEQQREQWIQTMVTPLISTIRGLTLRFAAANRYQLIIPSDEEATLRRGSVLQPGVLVFSNVDSTFLAYLNSSQGKDFRKTVPIDDLTQPILKQLNGI
ncbi:tetratricopeptide repeat protein [Solidesulfovibrio sp.]